MELTRFRLKIQMSLQQIQLKLFICSASMVHLQPKWWRKNNLIWSLFHNKTSIFGLIETWKFLRSSTLFAIKFFSTTLFFIPKKWMLSFFLSLTKLSTKISIFLALFGIKYAYKFRTNICAKLQLITKWAIGENFGSGITYNQPNL